MIKSIIFDWGGVLIEQPTKKLIPIFADYFSVPEEEFEKTYLKHKDVFQKGIISEEQYWTNLCDDLNIDKSVQSSLWKMTFKQVYEEKSKVFELANLLKKKHFKIGFLSNTEPPSRDFFFKQDYKLFDQVVFSCEEGIRKPDRIIYEIILKKLETLPGESIFIDDKKENIIGAKNVGMHAIQFKNPYDLKNRLYHLINL